MKSMLEMNLTQKPLSGAEIGFLKRFRLASEQELIENVLDPSEARRRIESFMESPVDGGHMDTLSRYGLASSDEPPVSGREYLARRTMFDHLPAPQNVVKKLIEHGLTNTASLTMSEARRIMINSGLSMEHPQAEMPMTEKKREDISTVNGFDNGNIVSSTNEETEPEI